MKKLYLHIGYPKCASTFLQKEIFRKNKKINYLRSKKNDVIDKNVELFWKNIYIKNNFYFKKNYKKDLYFLKNLNFKKTIIFSSEDITDYVKLKSVYHIDPNEVFRRIKTVSKFFKINFKIILVIRQQSDIIMSRFAQDHLFMNILPKYKNFSAVKKFFERKKKNKEEKKIFDSFNYYLTYKKLRKYFQKKSIKVLIFEQLALEPEIFFESLYEYLGLELKKNLRKKEKNNLNKSKKFQIKNEYFRKKHTSGKRIFGILNSISLMITSKKFIFGLISKHKKDKIKYFLNKIESFFFGYDEIFLSKFELIKIKNYYSSSNQNLSKILSIKIHNFNS